MHSEKYIHIQNLILGKCILMLYGNGDFKVKWTVIINIEYPLNKELIV